jgi:hypothetical protein
MACTLPDNAIPVTEPQLVITQNRIAVQVYFTIYPEHLFMCNAKKWKPASKALTNWQFANRDNFIPTAASRTPPRRMANTAMQTELTSKTFKQHEFAQSSVETESEIISKNVNKKQVFKTTRALRSLNAPFFKPICGITAISNSKVSLDANAAVVDYRLARRKYLDSVRVENNTKPDGKRYSPISGLEIADNVRIENENFLLEEINEVSQAEQASTSLLDERPFLARSKSPVKPLTKKVSAKVSAADKADIFHKRLPESGLVNIRNRGVPSTSKINTRLDSVPLKQTTRQTAKNADTKVSAWTSAASAKVSAADIVNSDADNFASLGVKSPGEHVESKSTSVRHREFGAGPSSSNFQNFDKISDADIFTKNDKINFKTQTASTIDTNAPSASVGSSRVTRTRSVSILKRSIKKVDVDESASDSADLDEFQNKAKKHAGSTKKRSESAPACGKCTSMWEIIRQCY